jgi:hypothetical protein
MDVVEVNVRSGAVQDHASVRGIHAAVAADRQDGFGQLGDKADRDNGDYAEDSGQPSVAHKGQPRIGSANSGWRDRISC